MHFEELTAIGQSLQRWRKGQHYTQQALGQKISIDRQTISDIERGQFTGSLTILLRYAHFAGYELGLLSRANRYPTLDELEKRYGEPND